MPKLKNSSLSASSRRLFARLTREYQITDAGGLALLRSGLIALDRAEQCEAQIARDGLTFVDRFGQVKAHVLLPAARDARAQYVSALRALNLAVGTSPKVGRPTEGL